MDEKSPEENKKVAFAKRSTAKFRSMDLTSKSLNRINNKIANEGTVYQNQLHENKEWSKKQ
jgi:predicted DNA binding CopG/RHH family protein